MSHPLRALPRTRLLDLAAQLEQGKASWPPGAAALQRLGLGAEIQAVAEELSKLSVAGHHAASAAYALRLLAEEREEARRVAERFELVWTGPEVPGSRSRDTGVVVRELFSSAERSVLVSTYVIYQGQRVFKPLAERMEERPELTVRLFVHIERPRTDQTPESLLLKNFAEDFRQKQWTWEHHLPEVYYDPRTLSRDFTSRASLHAKCIIVDDQRSFVTSANFTEAAHERNVEAGVLLDDRGFAEVLRSQFDALVASEELRRLAL